MAQKKSNKNLIFIILAVALLVILIFGLKGCNLFSGKEEKSSTSKRSGTSTVEWVRQLDDIYNFSFEFPPGTDSQHNAGINGKYIGYTISGDGFEQKLYLFRDNCDDACFEHELVDWWPKTKLEAREITINNNRALEIYFDDQGKVRKEVYIKSKSGVVLYFVFDGLSSIDDKISPDRQRIVESLEFTD